LAAQAGARTDLCIGILGARDPTDADQGQTPLGQPIHLGEKCGRRSEQQAAAEPARSLRATAAEPFKGSACRDRLGHLLALTILIGLNHSMTIGLSLASLPFTP